MMRAVVFERFGEPAEVLQDRDAPVPEPRPGEVRVRMLASPVNPSDLMTVRGVYTRLPSLPATPGYEGVGIVETAGGGALAKFMVGRRVAVLNRKGGNWAEQVVLPANQVIPLAKDLPLEQAAMFFVNPATAYVMTRNVLRVPRGEWLLQTAAGSALGQMVMALGACYGFRTLNVVRRPQQADELKGRAGGAAIAFDPSRDDAGKLRNEVLKHTGGRDVRFAIDPVAGATGSAVVSCLGRGGRMLVYGTLSGEPLTFSSRDLMTPGASIEGFWLANYMERLRLPGKLGLVRRITRLMRAGVLVSEVGEEFPLERAAEAVRKSEEPARGGKVLLRFARD
jgi:NADPH:quinone reductase-like Zn-dependent oxidoreductase